MTKFLANPLPGRENWCCRAAGARGPAGGPAQPRSLPPFLSDAPALMLTELIFAVRERRTSFVLVCRSHLLLVCGVCSMTRPLPPQVVGSRALPGLGSSPRQTTLILCSFYPIDHLLCRYYCHFHYYYFSLYAKTVVALSKIPSSSAQSSSAARGWIPSEDEGATTHGKRWVTTWLVSGQVLRVMLVKSPVG